MKPYWWFPLIWSEVIWSETAHLEILATAWCQSSQETRACSPAGGSFLSAGCTSLVGSRGGEWSHRDERSLILIMRLIHPAPRDHGLAVQGVLSHHSSLPLSSLKEWVIRDKLRNTLRGAHLCAKGIYSPSVFPAVPGLQGPLSAIDGEFWKRCSQWTAPVSWFWLEAAASLILHHCRRYTWCGFALLSVVR